jgi:hypothetical protein
MEIPLEELSFAIHLDILMEYISEDQIWQLRHLDGRLANIVTIADRLVRRNVVDRDILHPSQLPRAVFCPRHPIIDGNVPRLQVRVAAHTEDTVRVFVPAVPVDGRTAIKVHHAVGCRSPGRRRIVKRRCAIRLCLLHVWEVVRGLGRVRESWLSVEQRQFASFRAR